MHLVLHLILRPSHHRELTRRRIQYLPTLNTDDYILDPTKIIYGLFLECQVDPSGSIEIYDSVFVGFLSEGRFLLRKGKRRRG